MLIYPRAELLALRKLPHVSERGSDERADEVLPKAMPQRGEGIGSLCLWDPSRPSDTARNDRFAANRGARAGAPRYGSYTRAGEDGEIGQVQVRYFLGTAADPSYRGMKKFEVSPTNRYYGLPVDGATPVPTEPRTRERKGGAIGHGKDGGDIGGGQMGSFQIQSRTGLGLGVGGGIGGRRGDRHSAEDGGQGIAGSRIRRTAGEPASKDVYRPAGKPEQAEWRRGKPPPGLGDRTRPIGGAERRYVTAPTEGRRQYGGNRVEEDEGTPEWMMDDEVPAAISGIGYERSPAADQSLQDNVPDEGSAGFARFAGGEGVDGIAAYRKEMQARERRMRGLPEEEQVVAPTLQHMQDDGEEISFLLPTARKVHATITSTTDITVVAEPTPTHTATGAGRASRFTKHFETPIMSQANIVPTPTKAETDAKQKTALLAGILGISSPHTNTMSPAYTASPMAQTASPAVSSSTPGMPLFLSGPPPTQSHSSSQGQSPAPPAGPGDDHMSRLLSMLKSGGSNSSGSPVTTPVPAQASMSSIPPPNFTAPQGFDARSTQHASQSGVPPPTQSSMPPSIQTVAGLTPSGSVGRASRFFGRQSGTTSSAQSPAESPVQAKTRLDDKDTRFDDRDNEQFMWNKEDSALSSPPQHVKQVAPSNVEESRSPMNQQPQPVPPPPGMFPSLSRMFRPEQPMPPPPGIDMMSSPMRPGQTLNDQDHQPRYLPVFPPGPPAGIPPPFWQGGPHQPPPPPLPLPVPYGSPLPPHNSPYGHMPPYNPYYPPPGMPGIQSRQRVMLPPHLSPAVDPAYPIIHLAPGPGPNSYAGGYPYPMPPPGQPPYGGQGGMPPPPGPGQSHGQMTNDLMSLLGSMQGRNQEPRH